MPFQYSPLLGSVSQARELEATFAAEESDVEEEDEHSESRPLNPVSTGPPLSQPGTYDFENLDYDYPPPGSPPRPSVTAIPNNAVGNTNGQMPTSTPQYPEPRRRGFLQKAVQTIFPNYRPEQHVHRPVGGGTENDGVFANMNAKPSRGRVVRDGDSGIYVVPEEVQEEAPPSYASAQADAVPPYWETTIHAPAGFGGLGEIMVDGLPTGSFFSFVWNFLVSMSFQFVGFLLTFLLHSTHAAKLGSRAGLGITLIHYGFYLRTRTDVVSELFSDDPNDGWSPPPTAVAAATPSPGNSAATGFPIAEGTSEWLSFLLMTVGWFILLTSIMAFWRVKRWERNIMANNPPEGSDTNQNQFHNPFVILRRSIGFPGAAWRSLRNNERPPDDEEAMLQSNGMSFPNPSTLPQSESGERGLDQEMEIRAHAEIARIQQERLQETFRQAGLIL